MLKLAEDISATDLDGGYSDMPAWRLHRVENIGVGISALYLRIHHVIGDGMSMVGCMAHVFKEEDGSFAKLDFIPTKRTAGDGSGENKINPTVSASKVKSSRSSIYMVFKFVKALFDVLLLPLSAYDADIKFTSSDKKNLIMTKSRKVIYFPSVKLDIIKGIKNAAKVTLNDVMLSVTSGAIHRYCLFRKDPLMDSNVALQNRALVPFGFPRSFELTNDKELGMRNYWAFLSIPMPIVLGEGAKNPDELCVCRLNKCHQTTLALKKSPLAFIALWVQNTILPFMPTFMSQKTAMDLVTRHSMVFSNVPGPTRPLWFCNNKVIAMQSIFPNLISQVILMSYCDCVFANMVLDDEMITNPELLGKFYLEEIADLCRAFKVDTGTSLIGKLSDGKECGIISATGKK